MSVLVYKGRRISTKNKIIYCYMNPEEPDREYNFLKSLYPLPIGGALTCEIDGNTCRGPYKKSPDYESSFTAAWSIEERACLELREIEKLAKVKSNKHIDSLIETVKENTSSMAARRRIALYIYTKLLS